MAALQTIINAIQTLKPISFTYQNASERIGNPYAVYILKSNNTTKVHIVQTSGYTSSGQLNKFKQFNIEHISNVKIQDENISFVPDHPDYKPESDIYNNVLAQV